MYLSPHFAPPYRALSVSLYFEVQDHVRFRLHVADSSVENATGEMPRNGQFALQKFPAAHASIFLEKGRAQGPPPCDAIRSFAAGFPSSARTDRGDGY